MTEAIETCGNCKFAQRTQQVKYIECNGLPGTPIVVGVMRTQQGDVPDIRAISPTYPTNRKACSLFRERAAGIPLDLDLSAFASNKESAETEQ